MRLGHSSLHVVQEVLTSCNLQASNKDLHSPCTGCSYAKSQKIPSPPSTFVYYKPLDVVYCDIWCNTPRDFVVHVCTGDLFLHFYYDYCFVVSCVHVILGYFWSNSILLVSPFIWIFYYCFEGESFMNCLPNQFMTKMCVPYGLKNSAT